MAIIPKSLLHASLMLRLALRRCHQFYQMVAQTTLCCVFSEIKLFCVVRGL